MQRELPPRHAVIGLGGDASMAVAATAGLDLHERFGTRLEFVHAVDLPKLEWTAGQPERVAAMEASIEANAFDELARALEENATQMGSQYPVREHLLVTRGTPAKVVLNRAELNRSDLIILGPHLQRGLLDFGSTARAVLAKAPCDVWIQPGPSTDIQRILVPVDLSEESAESLRAARTLALHCGASITALHCFMPPDLAYAASPGYPMAGPTYVTEDVRNACRDDFERSMAAFDWEGTEHHCRFIEARPAAGILEQQEEHDLVVMGTHGRTGLSAALLGNVAYAVLKNSKIPVLAIRQAKREMLLA